MLTSDLLINTVKAGIIQPSMLELTSANLELARTIIELFTTYHGSTRGELDEALLEDEGDHTNFRVRRGLAHLLYGDRCDFTTHSHFEPTALRERAFALAALERPTLADTNAVLEQLAQTLSLETGVTTTRADLERSLYADLKDQQIISFSAPTPEWLLNRYNLAQAQGVLYKASEVTINAHRNDPGEYKLLFKYLKLFGLMHRITGDPDAGYTITLDGPLSLFKSTTMYGVRFAAFLPALLHATRWNLTATVHPRIHGEKQDATYTLDSSTTLQSHYPPGKVFDSILEHGFAERFAKLDSPWRLEREVDLVDLGGTVMIPDFRLVHEDGRAVLLEIIGYWRPEYLRRKFDKIAQSNRRDLVIAISERLNLGDAQKNLERISHQILWFKGVLEPKRVVEVADRLEAGWVSRLD
jgi:uncharacterized protein